jgi:hypothetical protein
MANLRSIGAMAAGCALVAAACLADASVDQKTQFKFGGFMGGMINAFGGKSTHEGSTSTTYVRGDRKAVVHETSGEIVDLDAEKIYYLDYGRKTYKVVTFDELRKQFEEQKARAEKQNEREAKNQKKEGPEYEVDFDVKDTGAKEVINGFNTHEVVLTITVHEKGKKVDQSGGVVLTSDMWIGPHLAAMKEIGDFDRRYFAKLYGKEFGAADMAQMAVLMASNPAFGKAMKALAQKSSSFNGSPIKTIMTVEAVAGSEQKQQAGSDESSGGVSSIVGGFMKRAQQRKQSEGGQANRGKLLDSSVEVTRAAMTASANDVAIPAGFTQK